MVGTSHPSPLSPHEYKFVQYLDTLIESIVPQVRQLGRQAKTKYVEEKKQFEPIPITLLSVLSLKSREINARLREALMSSFNVDLGGDAQIEQSKDSLAIPYQAEL